MASKSLTGISSGKGLTVWCYMAVRERTTRREYYAIKPIYFAPVYCYKHAPMGWHRILGRTKVVNGDMFWNGSSWELVNDRAVHYHMYSESIGAVIRKDN